MALAVRKLAGALGAEVSGVDLWKPLADGDVGGLREAILDHGVVFLRGQNLSHGDHLALARALGEPDVHPIANGLAEHPEIIRVESPAGEGAFFGTSWHTDNSFFEKPSAFTILYSERVPPVGGDTLFASMERAWEALSEPMRRMLEPLKAVHSAARAYDPRVTGDAKYKGETAISYTYSDRVYETHEHPVMRTHPETGRKSLYVNPMFTERIVGLNPDESTALLEMLHAHATRPEFTCRVSWEPGQVTIWDNRSVQHYAIDDYHAHERVLYRVTLEGTGRSSVPSMRLLVLDAYAPEGRAALRDAGGTEAGSLYASMLRAIEPAVRVEIAYPADPDPDLPSRTELTSYEGIAWTGSSLTIHHEDDPRVARQIDLAGAAYRAGVPSFGSCWAAQLSVVAAGGRCTRSRHGREFGIARGITLSLEGRSHPLFAGKPTVFDAFTSHADEVGSLSAGTSVLAGNTWSRVQAVDVRRGAGRFWAVQYHPEYDLHEVASLCRLRRDELVAQGTFASARDADAWVENAEALHAAPDDVALAAELDVGADLLDASVRTREVANWVAALRDGQFGRSDW